MWLSQGDFGTGVTVGGSPVSVTTSGGSGQPAVTTFSWNSIFQSPYFWAAVIIALFVLSRKK